MRRHTCLSFAISTFHLIPRRVATSGIWTYLHANFPRKVGQTSNCIREHWHHSAVLGKGRNFRFRLLLMFLFIHVIQIASRSFIYKRLDFILVSITKYRMKPGSRSPRHVSARPIKQFILKVIPFLMTSRWLFSLLLMFLVLNIFS